MIVFKGKTSAMLDRITKRLDQERVEDYEVTPEIPSENPGITGSLVDTKIYVPTDLGYYDIDDYVKSIANVRTVVSNERDVDVIQVRGNLTEAAYFKIIKYLVKVGEFCSIIDE